MINVVFIVNRLRKSGPVNVLYNICKYLNRDEFTPIIITLMSELCNNSRRTEFEKIGVAIKTFKFSYLEIEFRTRNLAQSIEEYIDTIPNSIIHVHLYHPIILASHFQRHKVISTIHSISGEDYIRAKGYILGCYMSFRLKRNIQKLNQLTVISDYMKSYYGKYCKNIMKISNGVENELLYNNKEKQLICKELNIDPSKDIYIVVGHLSKLKNPTFIVKELSKSRKDFNVYFLGCGDELSKCIRLSKGDGRFHYIGYVDNVRDYLSVADLFISASYTEGLPMAVLEAIMHGVPALLSSIPPHKEISESITNGVFTFRIKPNELLSIVEQVDWHSLDKNNIKLMAEKYYSANVMTQKYEKLYSF